MFGGDGALYCGVQYVMGNGNMVIPPDKMTYSRADKTENITAILLAGRDRVPTFLD